MTASADVGALTDSLVERIRSEADIADRPGQFARLNQIADEISRIQRDAWTRGLMHGRHFPWAKPDEAPYPHPSPVSVGGPA